MHRERQLNPHARETPCGRGLWTTPCPSALPHAPCGRELLPRSGRARPAPPAAQPGQEASLHVPSKVQSSPGFAARSPCTSHLAKALATNGLVCTPACRTGSEEPLQRGEKEGQTPFAKPPFSLGQMRSVKMSSGQAGAPWTRVPLGVWCPSWGTLQTPLTWSQLLPRKARSILVPINRRQMAPGAKRPEATDSSGVTSRLLQGGQRLVSRHGQPDPQIQESRFLSEAGRELQPRHVQCRAWGAGSTHASK